MPLVIMELHASHPGGEAAPKGWTVRPLKWYVSWVQTVARQVGPYLPQASSLEGSRGQYERTSVN